MKKISVFLSEIFQFLKVKFSIYLNRRVFVMLACLICWMSGKQCSVASDLGPLFAWVCLSKYLS